MLTLYYNGVISAPVAEFNINESEALELIYAFESVTNANVSSYRRDWVYKCDDGTKMIPCGMPGPGGLAWEILS